MTESEIAARIAARRTELDELEEGLVKQLAEVRAERDELAVAERVWQRMAEQLADRGRSSRPGNGPSRGPCGAAGPAPGGRHGRARASAGVPAYLGRRPPGRGPVATRTVGEALGLDTGVRGKLEPLRGKLTKLADRGRLRKLPDGRFTTRL